MLGMIVMTLSGSVVSAAQAPDGDERSQFRFEFQQTESHRGLGVEGWIYNGLPWRITNVRLKVDCVDANGTVTASSAGWVIGDVPAAGSGYFYITISSRADSYRVSVPSYTTVARETPQAP